MTIKVNNKSYNFKFTIWTIERACELAGVELNGFDEFMSNHRVKGMLILFCAALEIGSKGKQILNEFDMDDLIDKMKKEDFFNLYKEYLTSIEQIAIKVSGFGEIKKN